MLEWEETNSRSMPWKKEKNPYKIWLSEIIMQQTRVEQGKDYYLKFVNTFPTVESLALASEDKVLKMWEGLGYYSRARNLHFTAKYIAKELNGVFPKEYNDLLQLKGVGVYTAAAIASFAYNLPYAVVDGNVVRVLSRYFGEKIPFDTSQGKKRFQVLADLTLDKNNPAVYNQAIMDFGATVCTPKKPKCFDCPFKKECYAFLNEEIEILPVKSKKTKVRNRYFLFFVMEKNGKIWVQKREGKDIWQGLYQFPMKEIAKKTTKTKIKEMNFSDVLGEGVHQILSISKEYSQLLSHQRVYAFFIKIAKEHSQSKLEKLDRFAFPRIIVQYLSDEKDRK